MFMSYPAVFRKKEVAEEVSRAYQIEEGIDWTVLEKSDEFGGVWYVPCRVKDYDYDVKVKGWVISE